MKWKRVLAFAMSAALLISAPFTNASLVYADEAVEQGSGMENAESEGEESGEAWSGTVDHIETDPIEKMREGKIWNPSEAVSEQPSGVKISDEMLPHENRAETAEPETEKEKSGRVTLEETESDAAARELLRNGGRKDPVKDLLNEETVAATDMVRVIIVLEGNSIIENDSEAEMSAVTRARSRNLERRQDSVISEIEDTVMEGEELDIRYQYTWLLNGVATEVPYGMVDEIKEVQGVKEVILQPVYSVADNGVMPYTIFDGEMIGRDDTWKGTSVATPFNSQVYW